MPVFRFPPDAAPIDNRMAERVFVMALSAAVATVVGLGAGNLIKEELELPPPKDVGAVLVSAPDMPTIPVHIETSTGVTQATSGTIAMYPAVFSK